MCIFWICKANNIKTFWIYKANNIKTYVHILDIQSKQYKNICAYFGYIKQTILKHMCIFWIHKANNIKTYVHILDI